VFDRFRQAESSSTRQFGGLGLGLAIVRHLTELHKGTVTVTSPGKGKGATFIVKFPSIEVTVTNNLDSMPIDNSAPVNGLNGTKILIVDDDPDSRDLLTFILEKEGVEVSAVASAQEALIAFKRSTPDLIISDIGMPEIDGYTLISQIRSLPEGKTIPAIALTAHASELNRQRCLDCGFHEHIAKPINIPHSIAIITQLIR
jgi:CheY-like chemotaxis protein